MYPISIRPQGEPYKAKELVPCGKCPECLADKRSDWTFRIKSELKSAISAWFLTLTYSPELTPKNIHGEEELCKRDLQLFTKRLRSFQSRAIARHSNKENSSPELLKTPQIKYYSVGEYGSLTNRPHYHSIIFNVLKSTIENCNKIWGKGFVKIGSVNDASIHYVTKYVINKESAPLDRSKPFSLISNGFGENYIKNNFDTHKSHNPYVINNGIKQKMPRYIKNKIYDDWEIEEIGKQNKENAYEKRMKKKENIKATGQDPERYETIQRQQAITRFNKLITKGQKI